MSEEVKEIRLYATAWRSGADGAYRCNAEIMYCGKTDGGLVVVEAVSLYDYDLAFIKSQLQKIVSQDPEGRNKHMRYRVTMATEPLQAETAKEVAMILRELLEEAKQTHRASRVARGADHLHTEKFTIEI